MSKVLSKLVVAIFLSLALTSCASLQNQSTQADTQWEKNESADSYVLTSPACYEGFDKNRFKGFLLFTFGKKEKTLSANALIIGKILSESNPNPAQVKCVLSYFTTADKFIEVPVKITLVESKIDNRYFTDCKYLIEIPYNLIKLLVVSKVVGINIMGSNGDPAVMGSFRDQTFAKYLSEAIKMAEKDIYAASAAQPEKATAYVIFPAVGVKACPIGSVEAQFTATFGGVKEGEYLISKDAGVDALIDKGKIAWLFYYFVSKDHKPFSGVTNEGIGAFSSIEDVIKIYGNPDPKSAADEYLDNLVKIRTLSYKKPGIFFSFGNNKLENIRVGIKK